jgi:hypothetical protein
VTTVAWLVDELGPAIRWSMPRLELIPLLATGAPIGINYLITFSAQSGGQLVSLDSGASPPRCGQAPPHDFDA